jgi:NADP-dependent 3-hydroxy acid dehydrogenase YdfG
MHRSPVEALDMTGVVVAITGGAEGIGLATARAFAGLGASIALADYDGTALAAAKAELRGKARELFCHEADVFDAASRDRFSRWRAIASAGSTSSSSFQVARCTDPSRTAIPASGTRWSPRTSATRRRHCTQWHRR